MGGDVLDRRSLNRATLARQLLLERSSMPVLVAVEHLVGLQAQIPLNPYTALWSRLADFRPDDLAQLLVDRKVVRVVVMRGTIHLVTADDCLLLRPLVQPILDKELARHPEFGRPLDGVDLTPVLEYARLLLAERQRSQAELRAAFAERFPDLHAGALAYACRNHLAFIQVPPRGVWGQSAQVRSTTAEAWLGRPVEAEPSVDDVVLRYLAAFGPAAVADVAAWSGLTGMREVVERLRPGLRSFRDERGRELFDLPDAPRPAPDTPASTRFLPEYDNVLLGHTDRSRFVPDDVRKRLGVAVDPRTVNGSVLYDGRLCGLWRIDRDKNSGSVTLTVEHVGPLIALARQEIEAEAHALLGLIAADASALDVRVGELDAL
jgi:hypothetical protein